MLVLVFDHQHDFASDAADQRPTKYFSKQKRVLKSEKVKIFDFQPVQQGNKYETVIGLQEDFTWPGKYVFLAQIHYIVYVLRHCGAPSLPCV